MKIFFASIILQALLEDHLVPDVEMSQLRRNRFIRDIPDTLYMVEDKPRPRAMNVPVDVLAAAIPGEFINLMFVFGAFTLIS